MLLLKDLLDLTKIDPQLPLSDMSAKCSGRSNPGVHVVAEEDNTGSCPPTPGTTWHHETFVIYSAKLKLYDFTL